MFPALKTAVGPDRLATLALAYILAKRTAPTHPHPMAPNAFPGNVLAGPAIAIVDRAYDAIRGILQRITA